MSEMLPCPFCGCEVKMRMHSYLGKWHTVRGEHAPSCPMRKVWRNYADEAEAIKAWNTRAERTCEIKQHRCMNCDHEINDKAYFVRVDLGDGLWTADSRQANYCPNCGRRVER